MTTMGQLQSGVVQILRRGTQDVMGYAFTVESGSGQLQRWLLYKHPRNELEIRPPPEKMADWTLSDWQLNAASLWKPHSFYVWAQADVYRHGGTYDAETWTQIPPASRLPEPTYPDVGDVDLQLDLCHGMVLEVLQNSRSGLVFACSGGLRDASSAEYWMLPRDYQPAGGTHTATVAPGRETAESLQDFVDVANRSWAPGCLFVITGCVNYCGETPPAMP